MLTTSIPPEDDRKQSIRIIDVDKVRDGEITTDLQWLHYFSVVLLVNFNRRLGEYVGKMVEDLPNIFYLLNGLKRSRNTTFFFATFPYLSCNPHQTEGGDSPVRPPCPHSS